MQPKGFAEHRPIFAGNSRSTGISQLWAGKTGSKKSAPFHIHILNPECIRTPLVLASKKFSLNGMERFTKMFHFSRIFVSAHDFFCQLAADSILKPLTFPIVSLNSYTPKFSGEA